MDKPETGGGLMWPPMLAFLLAACGTGEASLMQAPSHHAGGQLRVVTESSERKVRDCGNHDEMSLAVFDGSRRIFTHDYCSAYGLGTSRLVTDTRGKHYILLEHYQGRGTRASSGYLTIYGFAGDLDERARFLIRQPVDIDADLALEYGVHTPPGGGIIVSGPWTLFGELHIVAEAPDRSRTLVALDTASDAR